ncbi:hypothetical protein QTO34_008048 [Cnephaeus nilssonii]|uniref:Alpha-2,8-sialyltransferase 8F n=1 Tax=Cnephaeus nilssonii TaxID=3371016 RepID=A0AA40LTE2_CNENI|nr:hypothetical protein QTO34_008048 [Eptesicus nilssonii]
MSYEAESKNSILIRKKIFDMFPVSQPFVERPYNQCAVVGNGGILNKSLCGAEIDKADFVFRCNLPPTTGNVSKDVGSKTNLVTINPSIITLSAAAEAGGAPATTAALASLSRLLAEQCSPCGSSLTTRGAASTLSICPLVVNSHHSGWSFQLFPITIWGLKGKKAVFLEDLEAYGDAFLLLPAFSFRANTFASFKVYSTLEESKARQKVIYFHPKYLRNLALFWRTKGVIEYRLSSGLMIASVAIELCENVKLYGFWPFSKTVQDTPVSHHYYDNSLPKRGFHEMPKEYSQILQLHVKGILKLQFSKCEIA